MQIEFHFTCGSVGVILGFFGTEHDSDGSNGR